MATIAIACMFDLTEVIAEQLTALTFTDRPITAQLTITMLATTSQSPSVHNTQWTLQAHVNVDIKWGHLLVRCSNWEARSGCHFAELCTVALCSGLLCYWCEDISGGSRKYLVLCGKKYCIKWAQGLHRALIWDTNINLFATILRF